MVAADRRAYRSMAAIRPAALEDALMSTSDSRLMSIAPTAHYVLRFGHLYHEGRALAFPCDAQGRVLLDSLSERARANYLYARALVGREFATPAVQRADLH
jgi:hypothetical protein